MSFCSLNYLFDLFFSNNDQKNILELQQSKTTSSFYSWYEELLKRILTSLSTKLSITFSLKLIWYIEFFCKINELFYDPFQRNPGALYSVDDHQLDFYHMHMLKERVVDKLMCIAFYQSNDAMIRNSCADEFYARLIPLKK